MHGICPGTAGYLLEINDLLPGNLISGKNTHRGAQDRIHTMGFQANKRWTYRVFAVQSRSKENFIMSDKENSTIGSNDVVQVTC